MQWNNNNAEYKGLLTIVLKIANTAKISKVINKGRRENCKTEEESVQNIGDQEKS